MFTRIAVIAAALLGCSKGATDVHGTVGGQQLDAQDSVAWVAHSKDTPTGGVLTLWVTDRGDFCSSVRNGDKLNGAKLVLLSLGTVSGTGEIVPPTTPGQYQVSAAATAGGKLAAAHFYATALCGITVQDVAVSGSVDVKHLETDSTGETTAVGGDFQFTFAQGSVQGSFEALGCDMAEFQLVQCVF